MSDTNPTAETTEKPEGKAPEFEGDFDAEKAKRLVANLRADVASLTTERDAVKAERDEFKAAAEQSGDAREAALKKAVERAEAAEKALAIKKHNLPDDIVEEFADYLTGTPEEVEAKAAKLASRFAPKEEPKPEGSEVEEPEEQTAPPARPRPDLQPGHGAEVKPEVDEAAIARAARRGGY